MATIVIKKYANRKLHREGDIKYLSMLELAELAATGVDVMVVCDRTGRDITLECLSRALYERLKDYKAETSDVADSNKSSPFKAEELSWLIAKVPARKKV